MTMLRVKIEPKLCRIVMYLRTTGQLLSKVHVNPILNEVIVGGEYLSEGIIKGGTPNMPYC